MNLEGIYACSWLAISLLLTKKKSHKTRKWYYMISYCVIMATVRLAIKFVILYRTTTFSCLRILSKLHIPKWGCCSDETSGWQSHVRIIYFVHIYPIYILGMDGWLQFPIGHFIPPCTNNPPKNIRYTIYSTYEST